MAGIGGGNGKAADQRRLISRYLAAGWFGNGAVQTAAAHLQILAGPVIGKCDGEADAVGLAIRPCAIVHDSIDPAMCRKHGTIAARARSGSPPCRHGRRPCDFKSRARALELCHVRTFRIRLSKGCDLQSHSEGRYDEEFHRFLLCVPGI